MTAAALLLVTAEESGEGRTAEFVVVGGGAEGGFDHDAAGCREMWRRRGEAGGGCEGGDDVAAEAGSGRGATAGGRFVADFSAVAGGGAREGGDGGRVVVGFGFDDCVQAGG